MAAYEIPFHIQEDIMKRLPVKSLIRFKSVSKAWKSLIDSSHFITAYNLLSHTQLLVSYQESDGDARYISYIDDGTFPQQMSVLTVPLSAKQFRFPRVIGSSHGLLCLLYGSDPSLNNKMAVICNPSIRKSVLVDVPGGHFVSFGVCPVTTDPKIVATRKYWDKANMETRCEAMVYTLSSGKWSSLSANLPTIPLRESWPTIATKQFIYWCVVSWTHNMIMSFDLTHENFEGIDLPDGFASHELRDFHLSKIRESLAIIIYKGTMRTVWLMEDGVQRVFTKLFNIITPSPKTYILGFRKNDIPIMLLTHGDRDYKRNLVVYEPNSEHNNVIEISGFPYAFNVSSYMETLILLGRSDCIRY